jgi:hypothetical protein
MIGFHDVTLISRRPVYSVCGAKLGFLYDDGRFTTPDGRTVAYVRKIKRDGGLASPLGGQRVEAGWWPRIMDWRAK